MELNQSLDNIIKCHGIEHFDTEFFSEEKRKEARLFHPVQIGKVELPGNILMAPMAGVTDLPYRILCKEMGVSLTCTEMVSAKAILYGNKNTDSLLEKGEEPGKRAVQLFGSDPEIMAEMAKRVEEDFDIIDVNMGCPVPKVVRNGEGSALMENLSLAEKVLRSMVKAVSVPITVKCRLGFTDEHINVLDFVKTAENAGVSAIVVHGRTSEQDYRGRADWEGSCTHSSFWKWRHFHGRRCYGDAPLHRGRRYFFGERSAGKSFLD